MSRLKRVIKTGELAEATWWLVGSAARGDDAWLGTIPISDIDLLAVVNRRWNGPDPFVEARIVARGNPLWRIDAQQIERRDVERLRGFVLGADLLAARRLHGTFQFPRLGAPTIESARVLVFNRYSLWLRSFDRRAIARASWSWARLAAQQRCADVVIALASARLIEQGAYAPGLRDRLAAFELSDVPPAWSRVLAEAVRYKRRPSLHAQPVDLWRQWAPIALEMLASLLGCEARLELVLDALSRWPAEVTPVFIESIPIDPRRTPIGVKAACQRAAVALAHAFGAEIWPTVHRKLGPTVDSSVSWHDARRRVLIARERARDAAA